MQKALVRFVNWFEVELKNPNKNRQFHKSLSELVSILFAVVFGVGLAQLLDLNKIGRFYDGSVLLLAYFAVISSWWGYRYATIAGPRETNVLNYCIDYVLLGVYWLLINRRGSLSEVLLLYLLMFALYSLWELIRKARIREKRITYAVIRNTVFFLLILPLFVYSYFDRVKSQNWRYILVLAVLLIAYRLIIRMDYRSKNFILLPQGKVENAYTKLIENARLVAENASVHLSRFAVGAAVLADSGNIYVGCNMEFDNYSNTIHAEEAAISAAVAAGEKSINAISVFTKDRKVRFPCGMCRQSLFEFGGPNLSVIACNDTTHQVKTMNELLPFGFNL